MLFIRPMELSFLATFLYTFFFFFLMALSPLNTSRIVPLPRHPTFLSWLVFVFHVFCFVLFDLKKKPPFIVSTSSTHILRMPFLTPPPPHFPKLSSTTQQIILPEHNEQFKCTKAPCRTIRIDYIPYFLQLV